MPLPTVTMLRMPPTPSASYFGPGLVITSIFFIEDAGILFSTSFGFFDIMLLGRPLTYTLKPELPFTLILPSPSTVTIGTLRNISSMLLVFESGSSSMSYVILSMSAFTSGFCATISTAPSTCEASFIYNVSSETTGLLSDTTKLRTMGCLPIALTKRR